MFLVVSFYSNFEYFTHIGESFHFENAESKWMYPLIPSKICTLAPVQVTVNGHFTYLPEK